jgi:hypothetical protein
MPGKIYRYLADDHARLEGLLQTATARPDSIDSEPYAAFRAGLLKHIGMEEKILLPAAQRMRGGEPLEIAAKLRLDHGALAALLVPSPTPSIVAAIRAILEAHNPIEEGPDGLYAQCERLLGAEADEVLTQLQTAPEVKVARHPRHLGSAQVLEATRRALAKAGYALEV